MSTQKRVFERLNKIEKIALKSQKVELALVDDFKKLSSKAIDSGSNAGGDVDNWLNKLPKHISSLKESQKDQKRVIELGTKIKEQAKDLGFDVPSFVLKEIEEAKQWDKELNRIINKLKGFKL